MVSSNFLRALAVTTLLVTACTADRPRHPDAVVAEESVRALSKRWLDLWKAGDSEGLAALLTDDVVIIRAHADPLMGPEQVKFLLRQRPEALRDDTWEPTSVLLAPSLDVAVEQGVYRRLDPASGTCAAIGNYISVYRREMGEWKLQSDAKWMTDMVVGDSLCRATNDGTGGVRCRKRTDRPA